MIKPWKNLLKDMGKTTSKYHNKKVIYNGIKFDSKLEKDRYITLKWLEKNGKIKDLQLQKAFELQPTFKKNGTTYRSIKYIADFYYYDTEKNKYIVEDTKGYRTDVYKLKKKLFEYKHNDIEIKEL